MIDFDDAPEESGLPSAAARTAGNYQRRELDPNHLPNYIAALNDRQREAALATDGPLIVLAGAGSGKTKMVTSRIAHLIQNCGAAPWQIMAVTFTNKAAAEMRERVGKALNMPIITERFGWTNSATPEIGTFHSVCVRILRREQARTAFTKPFVIYDDSDQLSVVKGAMAKLGIDDKAFNPKAIQGAINAAKCDAIEARDLQPPMHDLFAKKVKDVYEQYEKDMVSNNAVDFGEILCLTYRLFRDNPDIRQKYQKRFRYIHVDEYQDTNKAQYFLLSMLASAKYGGHENICVVGDEDQSIYKWRGADINNILDFEKDYPGARVVKLEQNYRSTQTIIRAAAHVIKNNTTRKDKTLWTANDEGVKLVRYQLPNERAEAEAVVSEVKKLAQNEGFAFNDFAIFYRTNAQSRQFEDVLRREKITYQIVGGLRFYDRKEIKDILSYFKVIQNPADSVALKRIINTPARGIGKSTIEKIEDIQRQLESGEREIKADLIEAKDLSFWGALCEAARDPSITSGATAKKLAGFVALMQRFMAEQPKLRLSELYYLILDETGMVRDLKQEGTEESLARVENLEEFDTIIQEFEESAFENIKEEEQESRKKELLPLFLEQALLASDTNKEEQALTSLKLMTLHSSKGLEFPVVFLVGMEEGLFPSLRAWEEAEEEDVEEERRLCYVGITRARQRLFMFNVATRRIWGRESFQEPSRFLSEIPADLIELHDLLKSSGFQKPGYGGGGRRSSDDFSQASYGDDIDSGGVVIGRKIQHPEYGIGTLIGSEGSGNDQKVVIEFKNRDRRKFLMRYVQQYLE